MSRVYFFQKRNPTDGTLLDHIVDAADHDGFLLFKQPRHFKYIGWSDGRFINKCKDIQMPKDRERGDTPVQLEGESRQRLLDAYEQELEFAKANEDMTPPRDLSKVGIDGGPIKDPYLKAVLDARSNG